MSKELHHMNEQLLLLEASKGNELAFKELFDQYKTYIYSVAFRILKTANYSEDVLQEVFLKVWLNREKLAEINNFKAYIATIISHHIYNLLRKLAYESIYAQQVIRQEKLHYSVNDFYYMDESSHFYSDLEKGMSSLTPQQEKIFRLSRIDGLKHSEIAALLHISKETVKKHVMASLQIIRSHMNYYHNTEKVLLLLFLFLR